MRAAPMLAVLILAGCAGPARIDRAFRSTVSEVDVGVEGTYSDSHTGRSGSGGADVKFILRDPKQMRPPFYVK